MLITTIIIAIALGAGAWIATFSLIGKIIENMRAEDNGFASMLHVLLPMIPAAGIGYAVIKGAGF